MAGRRNFLDTFKAFRGSAYRHAIKALMFRASFGRGPERSSRLTGGRTGRDAQVQDRRNIVGNVASVLPGPGRAAIHKETFSGSAEAFFAPSTVPRGSEWQDLSAGLSMERILRQPPLPRRSF